MSGYQSKNVKDKGRGHKVNKKGWALSAPYLQDPTVSETLSKPTVLLEERKPQGCGNYNYIY